MKIKPIDTKNKPVFKMRMFKTNVSTPLKWSEVTKVVDNDILKENHYIRNGLKLDVYEIKKPNGTVFKGKLLSDLMDNPIVAKVQEFINGVKKEKTL